MKRPIRMFVVGAVTVAMLAVNATPAIAQNTAPNSSRDDASHAKPLRTACYVYTEEFGVISDCGLWIQLKFWDFY